MVLVMVAVSISLILAMSLFRAEATANATAATLASRARARGIAESGLEITLTHVEHDVDWRATETSGSWIDDHAFAGGSFSVRVEDGEDIDADGLVDGDGDLANDDSHPITIAVTGEFEGVTHSLRSVVTPIQPTRRLLFVVPNPTSLDEEDQERLTQFQAWNYDVVLIDESDSPGDFLAASSSAHVAYITENVYSNNLGTKLRDTSIGVVSEEGYLNDAFELADRNGREYSNATQISITDDTHHITATLGSGSPAIVSDTAAPLRRLDGSLAPGVSVLAERASGGSAVLGVAEVGATLISGNAASGRRVVLPWGGGGFDWSDLTEDGLTIARRALEWAAQPQQPGCLAHWMLDETSGLTALDSLGGISGFYRNGVTLGATSSRFASSFVRFDGGNDFVEVPHNDTFLLDGGTIVFWFRTDQASKKQGLISKDSTGYDTGGHVSISTTSGRIEVRLQSTGSSYYVRSDPISSHTWYQVAFAFGAAGMKLYVNGVLADSDAYAGGLGSTSGGSGNHEPMAIGVLATNSGDLTLAGWNYPLRGDIEDVRFYGRALTAGEAASLYEPPAYAVRWTERP